VRISTALIRARDLLEAFAAGPVLPRLRRLPDHVVARELPVLLPPRRGDGSPVGVVTGIVDLLYRDPATGRLVVADCKTDDLDSGEAETRTGAYAPQGAVYVRRSRSAFGFGGETALRAVVPPGGLTGAEPTCEHLCRGLLEHLCAHLNLGSSSVPVPAPPSS
jgi:hypothetical protein